MIGLFLVLFLEFVDSDTSFNSISVFLSEGFVNFAVIVYYVILYGLIWKVWQHITNLNVDVTFSIGTNIFNFWVFFLKSSQS